MPFSSSERGATPPDRRGGESGPSEQFYVVVFDGDTSSMFALPRTGEVIVGRGEDANLRLADPAVSRSHARLGMTGGEARIVDLGSQNGTLVNGERIVGARLLASGDDITICRTTLVYHSSLRRGVSRAYLDIVELRGRATEELERALRYDRPLSLLVVDLGKASHDRLAVQAVVRDSLRAIDIVGWAGVRQLWILLPECDGDESALIGERLLAPLHDLVPEVRAAFATSPTDGCDVDTLAAAARSAAETARAGQCVAAARSFQSLQVGDHTVLVADPAMTRVYALIERLATSHLPVLIWGETGTGKELAAAAVHHWSSRARKPLMALNCAAIPEQLVESALFGHERGAFTGAEAAKIGLFEAADGGTVFLDEIGDLSLAIQAKLLRTLETRAVTRVGDVAERSVDFRIVAATNRDLEKEVAAERFRSDLYFRLSGAALWLPPLRDRQRELALLAGSFLELACERAGRAPMTFSTAAMRALARYAWPGNVRELKNLVDFVVATVNDSLIEPYHLIARIGGRDDVAPTPGPAGVHRTFRAVGDELRELEITRMTEALTACSGNRTHAAALIQMPVRTFLTKMKKYGLK